MTNRVELQDSFIKALKAAPEGKRLRFYDTKALGLALQVTDKGAKSWQCIKRPAGARFAAFVGLGTYPALTLKEARAALPEVLRTLARGDRPRAIAKTKATAREQEQANTLGALAEAWLRHKSRSWRPSTHKLREALVRGALLGQERDGDGWRNARAAWRDRPVVEIGRRDVIDLVGAEADKPDRAARLLQVTREMLRWALGRDYGLEVNVAESSRTRDFVKSRPPRKRVLTDAELSAVWRGAGLIGYPLGAEIRLLLLTGCRRNEVAYARWSEFDLDQALFTVPPERMKGDDAHVVPLVSAALALVRSLPKFRGKCVFTTTSGARPFSGFSKGKAGLDRAIAFMRAEERTGVPGALPESEDYLPAWTLHDLRRTVRTRLAGLGVPDTVCELVIAHKQPLLRATYDQHRYDVEKREALGRWADALGALVEPPPLTSEPVARPAAQVVQLRRLGTRR